MAGDWIKWCKGLSSKPEVIAIAERLDLPCPAAAGFCMVFWEWLDDFVTSDDQDENGNACVTLALRPESINKLVGCPGFAEAIQEAGWLRREGDQFMIPNFFRHNTQTAKTRALTAMRVNRHRAEPVTQMKRTCNGPSVTKTLPEKRREEKRREEKRRAPPLPYIPPPTATSEKRPTGHSSPTGDGVCEKRSADDIAFDSWWELYPRKTGKQAARKAYLKARQLISRETGMAASAARERLQAAVERFAASPKGKDPQFCPYPATWLNQGRYDDDPSEWEKVGRTGLGPDRPIQRVYRERDPSELNLIISYGDEEEEDGDSDA